MKKCSLLCVVWQIVFSVGFVWLNCLPLCAQEDTIRSNKITTSIRLLSMGHVEILDTYLSPEVYTGNEIRFLSHRIWQKEGNRWSQQRMQQGIVSNAKNRANNSNEVQAMYRLGYGWHYHWEVLNNQLQVKAGALVGCYVGGLYNMRNGNNPAQIQLGAYMAPSAALSYHFTLWNIPFNASYQAEIPLIGVRFSPYYGQSYYELFSCGNYHHNIVATHIGNAASITQMLGLDISIKNITFRIGYLNDVLQFEGNQLKYHTYTHALLLGVVKKFQLIHLHP